MRRNFLTAGKTTLLFSLALIFTAISALAQRYTYQPPVQPFATFNPNRPMASWQCSQSQLALNTPMLEFLNTSGAINGLVDCTGAVASGGTPFNLTTPILLEFNQVNTLTAAAAHVGGNTTYTGTITNCATPNALIGTWYTITTFATGANNGTFGPVSACTATKITLPNPGGVAEIHAGAATNVGFQLVPALGPGRISKPSDLMAIYTAGTTGFTLGNTDNVLTLTSSGHTGSIAWVGGSGLALNSFITATTSAQDNLTPFVMSGPLDVANQALLIELTGTTPALTAGNGSVKIEVQWTAF